MTVMKPLRDKYVDITRQTLLDTALRLFTEHEYLEVSAEVLVRESGLTRGALYHHFDGKRGLFEAVFNELERLAVQRIRSATASVSDPIAMFDRGVAEFLDICAEPSYRQIVMLQGPIALGWRRWRELDQQHLGGILNDVVKGLDAQELLKPHPPKLIHSALFGTLAELCIAIAASDDPDQARQQAVTLVHDLLNGLLT
ncbi:TetR/AcrR family transcriptional regulator [Acinetobacter pittii]|uniref:TetR/AcrR family transcriptional regulator n=1 Tax=Acinetobacter pittii TaxID=48296 RepID=UPI0032B4EC40